MIGTGKSVALRRWHYYLKYRRVLGFTGSSGAEEEMLRYMGPCYVNTKNFNAEEEALLRNFWEKQQELGRLKKKKHPELDIGVALQFDDLGTVDDLMKSDILEDLATKGRHSEIGVFVLVQNYTQLPKPIRTQVDLLVLSRECSKATLQPIHKEFFAGFIPKLDDFVAFVMKYTENYGLVILKAKAKSSRFEDCIFQLSGIDDRLIPKFEVGDEEYIEECKYQCELKCQLEGKEEEPIQPVIRDMTGKKTLAQLLFFQQHGYIEEEKQMPPPQAPQPQPMSPPTVQTSYYPAIVPAPPPAPAPYVTTTTTTTATHPPAPPAAAMYGYPPTHVSYQQAPPPHPSHPYWYMPPQQQQQPPAHEISQQHHPIQHPHRQRQSSHYSRHAIPEETEDQVSIEDAEEDEENIDDVVPIQKGARKKKQQTEDLPPKDKVRVKSKSKPQQKSIVSKPTKKLQDSPPLKTKFVSRKKTSVD